MQLFAADDFSRQHFQMHFYLGALRVNTEGFFFQRRAVKIQQQKQKDELQRAAQRERELEKERMLTAKVVKPDMGAKTDKEPS